MISKLQIPPTVRSPLILKRKPMNKTLQISILAMVGLATAETPTMTLRSNAYGTVMQGITASDDGLSDLNIRPYLAGGKQIMSVEAGNNSTASAALLVNAFGGTTFGQFQLSDPKGSTTRAQLGWADRAGVLGASVFWGDTTNYASKDSNALRTNEAFHQWGLGLGMKMATIETFGQFNVITQGTEQMSFVNDNEKDYALDYMWNAMVGARNTTGPAIWDVRYKLQTEVTDTKIGTTLNKSRIPTHQLMMEIGQPIPTSVKDLKPYLGLFGNASLKDPNVGYTYALSAGIKFSAEYQWFENWNLMGGYNYSENYMLEVKNAATDDLKSSRGTPAYRGMLGLTYHKGALSIETMLQPNIADDGPSALFSGTNLLASTGVTWNF